VLVALLVLVPSRIGAMVSLLIGVLVVLVMLVVLVISEIAATVSS